jgi:hypothetical protein
MLKSISIHLLWAAVAASSAAGAYILGFQDAIVERAENYNIEREKLLDGVKVQQVTYPAGMSRLYPHELTFQTIGDVTIVTTYLALGPGRWGIDSSVPEAINRLRETGWDGDRAIIFRNERPDKLSEPWLDGGYVHYFGTLTIVDRIVDGKEANE